jgi:hypothetical protein
MIVWMAEVTERTAAQNWHHISNFEGQKKCK